MPSNPYAGYRPRPPRAQMPAGGRGMSSGPVPQTGPQVLATFGGRQVGWAGVPPLRAGQQFMGGTVMAGAGGGPGLTSPAPMPRSAAGGAGQAGQGGGAAGQQSGQPIAQAAYGGMGNLPAEIQRMFDRANEANEKRYGQLLQNEQDDKRETLTALGGWNSILQQGQADKKGVMDRMTSGWDQVVNLAGQNGVQADLERERRRREMELGANAQSLVSRGLTNTTIADSTRRGVVDDSALREQGIHDRQRDREIGVRQNMLSQTVPTELRLNEGITQTGMAQLGQLIPTLLRMNEGRQNRIENRTDEGPDMGRWAQLLMQAGAQQQQGNQQNQAAQAQAQAAAQWQQVLNGILGQFPAQYNRPTGANRGPGMGGWVRPNQQQGGGGGWNSPGGGQQGGQQQAGGRPGYPWNDTPQTTPGGLPAGPDGRPMPGGSGSMFPNQQQATTPGGLPAGPDGYPMPGGSMPDPFALSNQLRGQQALQDVSGWFGSLFGGGSSSGGSSPDPTIHDLLPYQYGSFSNELSQEEMRRLWESLGG